MVQPVKRRKKDHSLALLPLLDELIIASKRGRHLQRSGKPLTKGTIQFYEYLRVYLLEYEQSLDESLKIIPAQKLTQRSLQVQKNYWKKVYNGFTNYLYKEKGCYDNYVGRMVKTFRVFLNYLEREKNIQTAPFKQYFYVRTEEIPIVVLSPERVHFLINNLPFEQQLPAHLKLAKDIFVVGCTVALRYSDLMALTATQLEKVPDGTLYLKAKSQKTGVYTRVKLPEYVCVILEKYKKNKKTLLPQLSKTNLNKHIKQIAELAGWTEEFIKTRERKGKPVPIFKETASKTHYRFCDMLSSHTMRRTAITTMLLMGMNELMVRSISGHAANSKEFFRYVALVQQYLDKETDKFHENLSAIS